MKKSLILIVALMFVLGVASSAFAAANPFVDVPAKHWAYSYVMQLQKAGIVEGYNDNSFRGDKTMSRYEMAIVVAKAMAKAEKADAGQQAMIDKLGVEFAAELNNLGVRVAKLEKQVGTVKITGEGRLRWSNAHAAVADNQFKTRFRLNLAADVNENTSFFGRIGYQQETVGVEQKPFEVMVSQFTTKNIFNTGATLTAGRFGQWIDTLGYTHTTNAATDGVKIAFGKDLKVEMGIANYGKATSNVDDAVFATLKYKTSKATAINAGYIKEIGGSATGVDDITVWTVGATTKFAKNLQFIGEYGKNTALAGDPAFQVYKLQYGEANYKKQGTWEAAVEYYKAEPGTLFAGGGDYGTYNAYAIGSDKKAWALTGTYTVAKNITLDAYQTFQTKTVSTGAVAANYSRAQLNFMF